MHWRFFLVFLCLLGTLKSQSANSAEELVYLNLKIYYPEAKLEFPRYLSELYSAIDFHYLWIDLARQPNIAARLLKEEIEPFLALHPSKRPQDYPDIAYSSDTQKEQNLEKLARYEALLSLLHQLPFIDLPHQRLAADFWLTDLFLSYYSDLITRYWQKQDLDEDHGLTNQYEDWSHWPDNSPETDLETALPLWIAEFKAAIEKSTPTDIDLANASADELFAADQAAQAALGQVMQQWIVSQRPAAEYYQPLRDAFSEFQRLKTLGRWPHITQELSLGTRNAEVTQLALQLYYHQDLASIEKYLPTSTQKTPEFDAELLAALQNFQHRHPIAASNITDEATRLWLNRPPRERLYLLANNLKRLHHLPKPLNPRYLMLNIANQQLTLVQESKIELTMKAVVGRLGLRTPIMAQWLTNIVINPLWNVPPRLARNNLLPRARANPHYLAQNDYELIEGWHSPARQLEVTPELLDRFSQAGNQLRIVQRAGTKNQLGQVKFRLSNQQAIYLHDTPARGAFGQTQRALSSGCVRLEKAEQLAAAILTASGYSSRYLARLYASPEETYLRISPRVAVYLMYFTVAPEIWTTGTTATDTTPAGNLSKLYWFDDIYTKD